jgi:hypothetical protein
MKYIVALFALSLLLGACTTTTGDAAVRRRMVGVRSLDSRPGKIIENMPDGTIEVRINGVETVRGKWQVRNGYLIQGPAEDWSSVNPSLIESNKVLSISGNKAVLLSVDGKTQLTVHRQ